MIRPTVVATLEFIGCAIVESDHQRTSMSALIMDDSDAAVFVTHNNNWPTTHAGTKVIATISDLALVSQIEPSRPENILQFEFKNFGISIYSPMHTGRLNVCLDLFGQLSGHWMPPKIILRRNLGANRVNDTV
jgi:hypothetical protein